MTVNIKVVASRRKTVLLLAAVSIFFSTSSFAATPQEFYRRAQNIKGINAFAATCQSAHETGFWTSELWKKARNGAGIKADKKWLNSGKPRLKRQSQEVVSGKTVYRSSYFRAYKSLDEFLVDYGAKIKRDYPLSSKHSDTMWGYFSALRKGRFGAWATSPKYFEHMVDKAVRLAPKLLGSNWKKRLLDEYSVAKSRKLLTKNDMAIIEKRLKASGVNAR